MKRNDGNTGRIVFIGVVFILLISLLFLNRGDSKEDKYSATADPTPPGTNVTEEIISKTTPVTYDEEDCQAAIEERTLLTDLINLEGLIQTYTPEEYNGSSSGYEDDEMFTELIQDNRLNVKKWRFAYPNEVEIMVSADTMEILQVSNPILDEGEYDLDDARDEVEDIITSLASELEGIEALYEDETTLIKGISLSGGEEITTEIEGFIFYFLRQENGINTTDRMVIQIDTSGRLCSYFKTWNLDMPESFTPTVSEQDALTEASNYLNINEDVTCELWVVRPNYLWQYGERYGFSDGNLVWAVFEYYDDSFSEVKVAVWIDANEEESVGGF